VRVYAGIDQLSGKRHYLTETIPAGPKAPKDAEKVRTRLLAEVDDRRNPRTNATVNQLLERYLDVLKMTRSSGSSGSILRARSSVRDRWALSRVTAVWVYHSARAWSAACAAGPSTCLRWSNGISVGSTCSSTRCDRLASVGL